MKRGFTLIEAAIVACIVLILTGTLGGAVMKLKQTAIVEIGGKEVYRGLALCVKVSSAGAATTVNIDPPCEWPGRHFTDKDVRVTVQ